MKVVRSPSEIIALIKSCDNTTKNNLSNDDQHVIHSTKNCVVPLLQISQNTPKKILKPLGAKNVLKSNINVSEPEDQQESKMIVNLSPNNLRSKKLVSL